MRINVIRKHILFQPDASRVIARFLFAGIDRAVALVDKIMSMPAEFQQEVMTQV